MRQIYIRYCPNGIAIDSQKLTYPYNKNTTHTINTLYDNDLIIILL